MNRVRLGRVLEVSVGMNGVERERERERRMRWLGRVFEERGGLLIMEAKADRTERKREEERKRVLNSLGKSNLSVCSSACSSGFSIT